MCAKGASSATPSRCATSRTAPISTAAGAGRRTVARDYLLRPPAAPRQPPPRPRSRQCRLRPTGATRRRKTPRSRQSATPPGSSSTSTRPARSHQGLQPSAVPLPLRRGSDHRPALRRCAESHGRRRPAAPATRSFRPTTPARSLPISFLSTGAIPLKKPPATAAPAATSTLAPAAPAAAPRPPAK